MTTNSQNGAQSLEALLDSYLGFGTPETNEVRSGFVVALRNGDVLVDIGAKSEGIIPHNEVDTLDKDQLAELQIGQEVRVCVVDPEDSRGNIILSYLKVTEQEDWVEAEELVESQEVRECTVVGYNKGGLLARLGSIRGFVPASQLGYKNQINRAQPTDVQLRDLVGARMFVKVLEANQIKGRLILSELAADKEIRDRERDEQLEVLEVGQVLEGQVINLTDFGAFIDIGGIEGLVHSSEMSWKHVSKPSKHLKLGQPVKVIVIGVDQERKRVTFSMKQLEANPWDDLSSMYQEGQLVEVSITQLTRYGAFARINDEYRLEGLIHISELAEEHVNSPEDVVRKGQKMTARIIRLDPDKKQIGFSLKQVYSEKFMEQDLAMSEREA